MEEPPPRDDNSGCAVEGDEGPSAHPLGPAVPEAEVRARVQPLHPTILETQGRAPLHPDCKLDGGRAEMEGRPRNRVPAEGPCTQLNELAATVLNQAAPAAGPFAFGPTDDACFGWFHPRAPQAPQRRLAAVLCPPLGWEQIASHRALRLFADELAAHGYPVLRFDWPGTGDSAGVLPGEALVSRFSSALSDAIEILRARSGAQQVALIGIHLGATFAARAALERSDVACAVAWGGYAKGAHYLRELKVYRTLNGGIEPTRGAEEAAGLVLSPGAVASLQQLSIPKTCTGSTAKLLILTREDGAADPLARALDPRTIEIRHGPGYQPLMQEARKSMVPSDTFALIREWLLARDTEVPSSVVVTPPAPTATTTEITGPAYREESFQFGDDDRCFAIATHPSSHSSRTGVVFLNTASDPRVGPHRMYVRIARTLAAQGIPSLRFDPTGVGDGAITSANLHAYSPERLTETREAIQLARTRLGVERVGLVGLCSGAYVAFHAGAAGPGIAGQILINPQTFHWKDGDSLEIAVKQAVKGTRYYRRALFESSTYRRLFRGEVHAKWIVSGLLRRAFGRMTSALQRLGTRRTAVNVRGTFRRTISGGQRILFIFGEDDPGLDLFREQVGNTRALERTGDFAVDVVPGVDHTFSTGAAQRWLEERIVRACRNISAFPGLG